MDAIECIRTRISIRKFKPQEVPRETVMDVISTAQRSPSYKNSQPWEVMVLSGAKKEGVSELLIDLLKKGAAPSPDIPEPLSWPPAEDARISSLLRKRAEVSKMDLTDPEVLRKAKIANFRFYGAPHALYLFQEKSLTSWSIFDLGLFAQSLMLAAHAHGLGTVPQAFATDYAKETKKFLAIPETKRLVLGMAMGYPDLESKVNAFRTDREAAGDITTWLD